MAELTIVDNSTLSSVACSTKALLRYHHGYTSREEKATLEAGTAAHAAIAAFLDPLSTSAGDPLHALQIFADCYKLFADEHVTPGDRLSFENTARIMAQWFTTHPLDSFPFTVKHVEIGVQVEIADNIVICGRMDGDVEMTLDGSVYVLETKTTGNISPWWLQKFYLAAQLSGYIYMRQQHLKGGAQVKGAILNAIEFKKLPTSTKKCPAHGVPYVECSVQHARFEMPIVPRTPGMLEEWRKTALNLAKRWRDLKERYPLLEDLPRVRTQGTFIDGMCTNCEFKDWCAVGRPMELIDSMFIKDMWSPLDHAVTGRTSSLKP